MAQDTSRVLRMGVVYRGHVVAERVLDGVPVQRVPSASVPSRLEEAA